MFLRDGFVFLIVCVGWINSELTCRSEDKTYNCSSEQGCCPEGCCPKSFPIPTVSIALAFNVCTFILVLCVLCWCIQIVTNICGKVALSKRRKNIVPKMSFIVDETLDDDCFEMLPPPTYSVAIKLPTVLTTEHVKVPTYEEAVKLSQTNP